MGTTAKRPSNNELGRDATVERVAGGVAILRLDDGQRLQWPLAQLPTGVGEGSAVTLTALPETARGQLARRLANELLDAGSPEAPDA